jgi:putative ATP-binding cassette transporter
MKLIYLLLRKSLLTVALAMLNGLLSGASSTSLIALTNTALNDTKLGQIQIIGSFVGLCLLMLVTNVFSQVLLARLSQSVIFDMIIQLSRHILNSPLRQLEAITTPRLLATLTDDVQSVANFLSGFPTLCTNLAIIVSCLLYLSWLSPIVFLFVLGVLVLGISCIKLLMNRGRSQYRMAREEQDLLFEHFRTITSGIKELKLNRQRQQTFFSEDLVTTTNASRRYKVFGATVFSVASSLGLLTVFSGIGILLFVIPRFIYITPSVMFGYALIIIYIVIPLNGVLNFLPALSQASIALSKIESLGLTLTAQKTESEFPGEEKKAEPRFSWKRLDLIQVTHDYHREQEESRFILGPLNLSIKAGELIFIIGGNGSGKSTLAKLITGLYEPESGEIYVDKQPITAQNQDWYRQLFAAVFSDFHLFERLIGWERPYFQEQIKNYLAQLQLDYKVKVYKDRLSTTALSQGQRKRLALLSAYLEDRPIYLFDEWASDQDPVFREIFYNQLLPELQSRGKTVLVISHDDRYFHIADRVIKLDYGQIAYDRCLHSQEKA